MPDTDIWVVTCLSVCHLVFLVRTWRPAAPEHLLYRYPGWQRLARPYASEGNGAAVKNGAVYGHQKCCEKYC
ncbi:hypothetical protein F4780DRAFT_395877 [Xylariomycetidae sp. FL0641]|nr:hypothetical protein F4780DRAFT_395877 [Xylariomycetidae sp. FL0641]